MPAQKIIQGVVDRVISFDEEEVIMGYNTGSPCGIDFPLGRFCLFPPMKWINCLTYMK